MRTIVVLNPKGGCGKSTIATNIAAYFSIKGKRVTLADCDPQGSSAVSYTHLTLPTKA